MLAITEIGDAHLPFVERHLQHPFIIFDQSTIAKARSVTYDFKNGTVQVTCDNETLTNIAGVWYRRPPAIRGSDLPVMKTMQDFSATMLREFSWLMRTRFADAVWISDYFAILRAEDKLLQLETAARLGFRVPDTIITSSPQEARNFVTHHSPAITKPMQCGFFDKGGDVFGIYTTKIDDHASFSGLHLAPSIFQKSIDVDIDVRVNVVGERIFAAAISGNTSKEEIAHVRDWRISLYYGDLKIVPLELPNKIAGLCVGLVKELGLKFGAIDLVLDKKGKFWFLENNPNGQWAFVEEKTQQPIGKAIADLLEGR